MPIRGIMGPIGYNCVLIPYTVVNSYLTFEIYGAMQVTGSRPAARPDPKRVLSRHHVQMGLIHGN